MVDDVICKERGKIYHVPKSTEYRIHTETIIEAVMDIIQKTVLGQKMMKKANFSYPNAGTYLARVQGVRRTRGFLKHLFLHLWFSLKI